MTPTVLMLVTKDVNPDPRVEKEAAALSRAGLKVRVVGISDGLRTCRVTNDSRGFDIIRLPNPRTLSGRFRSGWLSSMMRIGRYYLECLRRMKLLLDGVSVVHCHDFDTLPLGYSLAKLWGSRLVYDSHEAFSGMFSESVPPIVSYLVDMLERMLSRKAQVITVGKLLSERFRAFTGRPALILRNVPSDWPEIPHHGVQEKLVIGYVGGLLSDRCIDELVKGFADFAQTGANTELRLAGFGPMESYLKKKLQNIDAPIEFVGKIPYSDVPKFLSQLSISVILFSRRNKNNFYSSPNKLFESCLVGTPVLASNFGELAWLVNRHHLGWTVNPDDPDDIRRSLEKIYALRSELSKMRQTVLTTSRETFQWSSVERDLLTFYRSLAPRTDSGFG